MGRIFSLVSLSVLLFSSCMKDEMDIIQPQVDSELVDISFQVATDKNNRMWYGPDESNKNFYPTWNTGDKVTVVADLSQDIIAPFKMQNDGYNTSLGGQINTWNKEANLYAIYPYREDSYSHDGGKFTVDMSQQTINAQMPDASSHLTTGNSMKNSVLLAMAPGVINTINEDITAENLYFRQAMSFLRFTIKENEEKYEVKRVTLKDDEANFVTKAQIWLEGDGIGYNNLKYSNEVSALIEAQDASGKSIINFAVFPTTLKNPILEIQAIDKDNNSYIFTRKLPANLAFERNIFNFFSSEIDLDSEAFTSEDVTIVDLNKIGYFTEAPAGNNWVVKSDAVLNDGNKLWELKNLINKSGKDISLKFIDVTKIDLYAAFYGWENVEAMEFPICEEIADQAFARCPDLKRVVMPALRKAGVDTFFNNIPTQVEFIVATNPGVKLQYGKDGVRKTTSNPFSEYTVLDRVNITLGNKELYDADEYGDNYFTNSTDGQHIHFGNITWK